MYYCPSTGEYPLSARDVRLAHPNTSFPGGAHFDQAAHNFGYYKVVETECPATYKEDAVLGTPELINGVYHQTWIVTPASEETISGRTQNMSDDIRRTRLRKLYDSDWTQCADAPVDKVAWAQYRQSLRDISEQPGFPWEISWPIEP